MNSKGYRANNGEGYVGETIQKIDRKKNRLNFICETCKNCTDWSLCNNRTGTNKCQKCIDCVSCLKKGTCDRFYCYKIVQAQITVDKKPVTVANKKNKSEAIEKKKEAEARLLTKTYIKKNGITILQIIKNIDDGKFKSNIIGKNTKGTNKYIYAKLETASFAFLPVQKTTSKIIQEFLNSLIADLAQSEIRKYYDKINMACKYAVETGILSKEENPMLNVTEPVSSKEVQQVEAFTLAEEITLIKYICTHSNLVKTSKCKYDSRTIRNLILLALLSLMRCGELGALELDSDIDLEYRKFIVDNTLSRDENGKVIMGENTKTGKKIRKSGKSDSRIVPFSLFDEEIITLILQDQIENAKSNKNNKKGLLFCRTDGGYIAHTSITNIFKRICRDAHIKLNLPKGCHIHMTRHTGITRLYELGVDVLVIAKIAGHMDATQFYDTYGHVLEDFVLWQLSHPSKYYKKSDLITKEIKKLIVNLYTIKSH